MPFCSVTLLYENADSNTLTPVYFRAFFFPGEKSRLDFPLLLFALSTLVCKYDSVILHEFVLPILSKASDDIL